MLPGAGRLDAWFDLALAYGSRGFTMSLISALAAELEEARPTQARTDVKPPTAPRL